MVIALFPVSYFLLKIVRIPDNGKNRIEISYSTFILKKITDIHYLMVKVKNILISITSKIPVSSFWEYIFLKKIRNLGRKNKSSQWLISFRKIQPCKLFLQAGRGPQNQKIHKVSGFVQRRPLQALYSTS